MKLLTDGEKGQMYHTYNYNKISPPELAEKGHFSKKRWILRWFLIEWGR
jgi:hypothetical protein